LHWPPASAGPLSSTNLIIIAGLAEIAAGLPSPWAWAATWPAKTEIDHYNSELQREYAEVETVPHKEKEEVKEFFAKPGPERGGTAAGRGRNDKRQSEVGGFMMKYELGLTNPIPGGPAKALSISGSL